MATSFEKLSFTKDWKNASDFPTYEENETQVRADMQALHDETRDFINDKLIPNIENMAVPGAGDMLADVYDTAGQRTDVYAYATAQANAAKEQIKAEVTDHLVAIEGGLAVTPGPVTLLQEFRTAGTYTVTLPTDAVFVYALAVGAGGGGGASHPDNHYRGGGGGAGGNARFVGPILANSISNPVVVIGAGGAGGVSGNDSAGCKGGNGGFSSAFGFSASGGNGGDYADGGDPAEKQAWEYLGAAGGGGSYGSSAGGRPGEVTTDLVPFVMLSFSAGGGGAGGSENGTAGAGGVCGLGSGGKGGTYPSAGGNGGQCCGGGGGCVGYNGGKGGDGYVAIWVQRSGITE